MNKVEQPDQKLWRKSSSVEFRPRLRDGSLGPMDEEKIPWADILEDDDAPCSEHIITPTPWSYLRGSPPLPVLLSAAVFIALLLYFLAQ